MINKKTLIFPLLTIAAIGASLFTPSYTPPTYEERNVETLQAVIVDIVVNDTRGKSQYQTVIQNVKAKITKGSLEGETVTVVNDVSYQANPRLFEVGDKIMIEYTKGENLFLISDFVRSRSLLVLFIIFIATVILVTGWQGMGAFMGMILSFIILFKIVLPQILMGVPPVFAAIVGSIFIIPLTFYSSHGFSKKTSIAVVSTLFTLVFAGVLATIFADLSNLTGLAAEETLFLKPETAANINFQGLLLAGMIISVLGILDDITISQASIVKQLKEAKPSMKFRELYIRSMRVGKDHIASLVNTLILVYTGASLPLLLLFFDYSQKFSDVINYEFMAEEIVRTLIGSTTLILAVPITTLMASLILTKKNKMIR